MIYLNLGRREVGKTTLACYVVSKAVTRVIFDPRGLYPSDARAYTSDDIANWFIGAMRPDAPASSRELVITPDGDVQECFDTACAYVKAWLRSGRTDIAFLIDELRFIKNTDGPDLNWVLRCATRASVVVVFTAHRPADVAPDIRAISDVWCIFQMTQEHDLKVITERCSPSVSAMVSRLKPRHFIAWNDALGTMQSHTHPERWYMPLKAANTPAAPLESSAMDDLAGDAMPLNNRQFDFTK